MRFLNIPNALSAFRIILVPAFILFYLDDKIFNALLIFVISGITDFLDGFLARRLNQISELGKILDPFADRILIGLSLLVSLFNPIFPVMVAVIIITREVIVGFAHLIMVYHGYKVSGVYFLGKLSTALIYFSIPLILLERYLDTVNKGLLYIANAVILDATILYLIIGIVYVFDIVKSMKSTKSERSSI